MPTLKHAKLRKPQQYFNLGFLVFPPLWWILHSIYLYDIPSCPGMSKDRTKSTFCSQIQAVGIVIYSGW